MRTVEPSPFDAGTCYLAGTRYKLDDPAPYLYKTTDFGKSWKKITSGIAEDDYVRVVRRPKGPPVKLHSPYVAPPTGASND